MATYTVTAKRLQAVLDNPCQETWNAAYSIVIGGEYHDFTLWQAWVAVDPDAPRSVPLEGPWPCIPDQFTLYRAIAHATKGAQA